ncbi:MAG: hypothetical protein ACLP7A_03915 [Desulfobaccales bacterium]
MRQITWSQNKAGTFNGKVGHVTLFTVAYYPERGYFIAAKLPGLNKTIPVNSEEAGKRKAEAIYQGYFDFLKGGEWYRQDDYPEQPVSMLDSLKKGIHHSKPIPPGNGETKGKRRVIYFDPSERKRAMKR